MWGAGEVGGDRFPIARKGYDRAKVDTVLAALEERVRVAEERARALEGQLGATKARLEELETDMRLALTNPERASKLVGAGASELLRSASDAALSIRTQSETTAAELIERARAEASELVTQARQTIQAELRTAETTRSSLLEEAEQARASAIEEAKREGRALVQQAKEYAERLRREAESQAAARRDEVHALERAAGELRSLLSRARQLVAEALERQEPPRQEPPLVMGHIPPRETPLRTPSTAPTARPDTPTAATSLAPPGHPTDEHPTDGLSTLTHLIEEVATAAIGEAHTSPHPEPVPTAPGPPPRMTSPEATTAETRPSLAAPSREEAGRHEAAPAQPDEEMEPGDRVARLEELFRTLKAERGAAASDATMAAPTAHDAPDEVAKTPKPSAAEAAEGDLETTRRSDDEMPGLAAAVAEEELLDPALRHRIEELFGPLHLDLSRRVKRLVQDELNTLLATIRASGREGALAWLGMHDQSAAMGELAGLVRSLVTAGRSLGSSTEDVDRAEEATDAITSALVAALTELTLSRVKAALEEAEEDSELVSVANTLYREVRTRRLDELANDYAATAFCTGVRMTPRAVGFVWLTRSGTSPCADCEDNVLAGVNATDELFPTGHENPPSHPGCTCLIAPVFA